MSFASVLVMSVKSRMFSLNTFASASAAACRLRPSGCIRKFRVGSSASGSFSPSTSNLSAVIVSLKRRFHEARDGDRLLMEQALELLLELVGLLLAQVVEPGLVAGQRRRLQRARQHRVVDLVDLQLEEDQVGRDGGELLLDVAVEFRVLGIGRVRGIEQPRVGAELAQRIAQRLVAPQWLPQAACRPSPALRACPDTTPEWPWPRRRPLSGRPPPPLKRGWDRGRRDSIPASGPGCRLLPETAATPFRGSEFFRPWLPSHPLFSHWPQVNAPAAAEGFIDVSLPAPASYSMARPAGMRLVAAIPLWVQKSANSSRSETMHLPNWGTVRFCQ